MITGYHKVKAPEKSDYCIWCKSPNPAWWASWWVGCGGTAAPVCSECLAKALEQDAEEKRKEAEQVRNG